jgi:hypothetical protein
MKFLIVVVLLIPSLFVKAQQTPAEQLALKIAQRMKDSLQLNDQQRQQIYDINMQLHNQKMWVRQHYTAQDSLSIHTQRAEGKRDSLYHIILTNEKYLLYKQKKRNLVSSN